jgi:hypothetical protein
MVKGRNSPHTLESLIAAIASGSPALAMQKLPRRAPGLSTDNAAGPPLALGVVGDRVGIQASEPGYAFDEQVIELAESDVYRRGQRKWFACPGLDGRACGSKRMKLYLPPGESTFACTDCHGITVPHTPDRPMRWRDEPVRQQVLRWHEPVEIARRSA